MSLSIQALLKNKGIEVKETHLDVLDVRWKGMQALRGNLEHANINDADIGIRNIPGGDHIE
nr:hypothetical protein [Sporosarcina jiandibaonis]